MMMTSLKCGISAMHVSDSPGAAQAGQLSGNRTASSRMDPRSSSPLSTSSTFFPCEQERGEAVAAAAAAVGVTKKDSFEILPFDSTVPILSGLLSMHSFRRSVRLSRFVIINGVQVFVNIKFFPLTLIEIKKRNQVFNIYSSIFHLFQRAEDLKRYTPGCCWAVFRWYPGRRQT